jgi:hypothetical protein
MGAKIKYLRRTTSCAAGYGLGYDQVTARRRGYRSGQQDKVTEAHNERHRGQRPWYHDQVPTRRRGHCPGHRNQISATHNEATAWAPRPNTRAQHTRVHFYPQHYLLCHLGLYKIEFEFAEAWAPRPNNFLNKQNSTTETRVLALVLFAIFLRKDVTFFWQREIQRKTVFF